MRLGDVAMTVTIQHQSAEEYVDDIDCDALWEYDCRMKNSMWCLHRPGIRLPASSPTTQRGDRVELLGSMEDEEYLRHDAYSAEIWVPILLPR